jgi:hypothetical protein
MAPSARIESVELQLEGGTADHVTDHHGGEAIHSSAITATPSTMSSARLSLCSTAGSLAANHDHLRSNAGSADRNLTSSSALSDPVYRRRPSIC